MPTYEEFESSGVQFVSSLNMTRQLQSRECEPLGWYVRLYDIAVLSLEGAAGLGGVR